MTQRERIEAAITAVDAMLAGIGCEKKRTRAKEYAVAVFTIAGMDAEMLALYARHHDDRLPQRVDKHGNLIRQEPVAVVPTAAFHEGGAR